MTYTQSNHSATEDDVGDQACAVLRDVLTTAAQSGAFGAILSSQAMFTPVKCNDVTMSLTPQDVGEATKGVRQPILGRHGVQAAGELNGEAAIADAGDLRAAQDLCRHSVSQRPPPIGATR